jgi:hypothetical protein
MEDIFPILEHLLPQCLWDKEFSEGEEARRWQVAGVGCGPTRGQPFRCQAVVDEVDILFGAITYAHAPRSVSEVQNRPRLYRPDATPAER